MKRIRDIISIILSIIILTNSILFYTTVWASTKLPSTSISIIKVQNQALQDIKFNIQQIANLKRKTLKQSK